MKIVDAEWSAKTVNILLIECTECGRRFKHRSDRWRVICPKCKARADLAELREKYAEAQDGGDSSIH